MRKICLSLLICCGIATTIFAQSKLDLRSRAALRSYQMEQVPVHNAYTKSLEKVGIPATHVTALISMADGVTAEQLQAEGVNVVRTRGNIAMVSMPVADVERISRLDCIKKLSLSRKVLPKMDKARVAMGVDKIHAGEGLPQAYTGKGVITGIVDTGMDPNHVNFRNSDGTSRIKQLTHIYVNSAGTDFNVDTYTGDTISEFTTDYASTYHGTHTMGIMAGGYRDTLTMSTGTTSLTANVVSDYNPYYGSAYESDIAASCGDMADMLIALGIEGVLDYAYRTEQPAVINLSLGSNAGARDGSETMSQYLDLAGEEAIICIAAGNEGEMPIAVNKTFATGDTALQTFIAPLYGDVTASNGTFYQLRYGQTEIFSNDSTEFKLELVIYNRTRGTIVFRHAITENMQGNAIYYASPEYVEYDTDKTNVNFTRAFAGYVGMGTMTDSESGRYSALIDCFVHNNMSTNSDSNYILGIIVSGKPGQRIDCFCDATYTFFDNYGVEGWAKGSTNGTISDMACAHNVLVVGSYNVRNSWVSLDKKAYTIGTNYIPGEVSSFSSYGTLIDGRNLPHVCAPGATIISSSNSYFIDSYANIDPGLQAKLIERKRKNYWHQEVGTSMATPAVAGAIALWLEADPTLTIDEVKEIATSTATVDAQVSSFTGDKVQWGAGKFNAYDGLKEVIRRNSSVGKVMADDRNRLVVSSNDNQFNIFLGGAESMNVTLYSISGQPVITSFASGDEIDVDTSALAPGIYVLSVNGCHNCRVLVK